MNSDLKVVPFFKGKINPKYANVSDSLKWAIPMMETQDSPSLKAAHKASEARAKARFEAKLKAKVKASLTVIS